MPRVLVNLLQTTGSKGGIEVYARELYRALGALETAFEFVGYASTELMAADHSWFPGEMIDSGISGEDRIAWARGELFAVSRAARRLKVDLIHGPAMFGPLFPPVPVVITVHDLLYFSNPELMQTKAFTEPVKWMERRGAAGATRLITISQYSATTIRKYLRFPDDHIDVIPLAARTGFAMPSNEAARQHDLFLAMGQRSPYKSFETTVRAWAQFEPGERPRLVITGGGAKDPLRALVDALELGDSIELRSWVSSEELGDLLATATALIDSTLATGFSLPAMEAMKIGLPVLLADTEVFREIGGDAADYFAAGDPVSLARAVQAIATNPAHQRELGDRGRARTASWSWSDVAAATSDSFEKALSAAKR